MSETADLIDHKAEALAMQNLMHGVPATPELFAVLGSMHATLYLAEQQRIANLIAYKQMHTARALNDLGEIDDLPVNNSDGLTDEIEAGLGLHD